MKAVKLEEALSQIAQIVDSIEDLGENSTRNSIIGLIRQELARQDNKWGVQDHDLAEWLAILMEEVGEVSKEIVEIHFQLKREGTAAADVTPKLEALFSELVQVGAVSVATIEGIERNKSKWLKS